MRYLSVCSGIEAASASWKPLNWKAVAFSEVDKFCCAALAHHYPDVPNLGDMLKIDGKQFKGKVDVLIGGTPCQSFSVAGKRLSLKDERGNLTLKFVELCDAIKPLFIIWENVPGVLRTNDNAFGQFLGRLSGADSELSPRKRWSNAGFVLGEKRNIAWRILNAEYFGVPQQRRRVFLVACPRDGADPREILFERTSLYGDTPKSEEKQQNIAACTRNGTKGANFLSHWQGGNIHPTLAFSGGHGSPGHSNQEVFSQNGGCLVPVCIHSNMAHPKAYFNGKGFRESGISYTLTARDKHCVFYENQAQASRIKEHKIAPSLTSKYGTGGGNVPLVQNFFPCNGFSNYSKRADISSVLRANMEKNTNVDLVLYLSRVRRLMPIECERLQGFLDKYTQIPYNGKSADNCPDGQRYKAIGNSMAVPVILWLGIRIQEAFEATTGKELKRR